MRSNLEKGIIEFIRCKPPTIGEIISKFKNRTELEVKKAISNLEDNDIIIKKNLEINYSYYSKESNLYKFLYGNK